MAITLPDVTSRFRCAHCGNLTRFDVVRTTRVSEFWHLAISGEPVIEESVVLDESIEQVQCRWCSATDRVEIVPRPEFGGPAQEAAGDGGP
ncbi:MAG: hypothetical protein ACOYO9_01470 [Candidatus Nanopelagicales bacterium]